MSARFAGESFEAYLREEAAEAERFTARTRLAVMPTTLVVAVALAPFSELARAALPTVIGFTLAASAYALGALVLARRAYHPALSYITTAADALLLTVLIGPLLSVVGDIVVSTKSPLVIGYFTLIVGAAFRLSTPLVWFATACSAVGHLVLLLMVVAIEPARVITELDDFHTRSVSATRSLAVAVGLLLAGGLVAVLVGRARDLVRRSLHTVTFLYADLRGFTAFIEERGDAAGAELVREYRQLARAEVARTGGRELKTEGDSFLVEFRTARQALQCATAILSGAEARTSDRPDLPLRIGVGLHAGEPVRFEQDYIGSAVNVAARLGQAADAGELLVSDVVRGLLRTSGSPPAREREGLALKGIADPPRILRVRVAVGAASGGLNPVRATRPVFVGSYAVTSVPRPLLRCRRTALVP